MDGHRSSPPQSGGLQRQQEPGQHKQSVSNRLGFSARRRTVVSGEAVDDVQVLPKRLHVLTRAQHGPHLRSPAADFHHIILTQEEVMGRHLTRHLDAFQLRCSDDGNLGGKRGTFATFVIIFAKQKQYNLVLPLPSWPRGRCGRAAGRAEPP